MLEYAYVYILASSFKHLYIGFTTKLEQRIWQHKNQTFPNSFTARYASIISSTSSATAS